jgi:hypothetical protein
MIMLTQQKEYERKKESSPTLPFVELGKPGLLFVI